MSSEGKPWYTNVYIMMIVLVSTIAVSMAALMLLLLPQSSEIVRFMQWRMINAKTFAFETDVRYQGKVERKDEHNVTRQIKEEVALETGGAIDRRDPESEKLLQTFSLAVGADDPYRFGGELRAIADADFFKFRELPKRIGTLHFDDFKDRWLRVDLKPILRNLDNVPFFGGEQREMAEEDRALLLEQLRATPFLRVENKLKSEVIGGVPTHHYQVKPEILFFKDYYVQAETVRRARELTKKERASIDAFFANVTAEDGELWIGKRDYYLYRARLRFRYEDGERSGVFSVTANFSLFNQNQDITTPTAGVEDVNALVESLLPSITEHLPLAKEGYVPRGVKAGERSGLPVNVPTAGEADPDKDGLANELEQFYGSDPNNPDTDGDGLKDGDEVGQGLSPTGSGKLFDFAGGRFD